MDPKFEQILHHLEKSRIDDQEFERVAAEIQDGNGWASFWISGGGDFGEDGMLLDEHLNKIPLITTTSDRALPNITKNTEKLLSSGWKGSSVAFATCKQLTPVKRRNINEFLEKNNLKSAGMFDSKWYAERLLRYPHLCKSLLGITLDYPALSPLPSNPRFQNVISTVGREIEEKKIVSLVEEMKDFVIVGQPGSGKTHLLREVAKKANAYFLVTEDLNSLAEAIRFKRPQLILVDDAHSKIPLLEKLIIFRRDTGADFKIAIDTWPSSKEELIQLLNISSNEVVELPPLSRDKIVELIKIEGITEPNWVIRSIVDQVRGKPGLASFLCQQFIKGANNDAVFGNSLLTRIKKDSNNDEELLILLSIFSLGGEAGVEIDKVSEVLDIPFAKLLSKLSALVTAGIIEEDLKGNISVQPALLRYNLIKDKVLNSPMMMKNIFKSISIVDIETHKYEIIQAVRVGAKLSPHELYSLLQELKNDENLISFAWLGRDYCEYLISKNPECINVIGEAALYNTPEKALPLLFKAINEQDPNSPGIYKFIEGWLLNFKRQDVIKRREIFIEQSKSWLKTGGNPEVIEVLTTKILSVAWDNTEADPGLGRTITISSGLLPVNVISKIPNIWKGLLELFTQKLITHPAFLFDAITEMNNSRRGLFLSSDSLNARIKKFREKFLKDLVDVASSYDDEGFKRNLAAALDRYNIYHKLKISEDFLVLYPTDNLRESEDYYELEKKGAVEVDLMVERWIGKDPLKCVKQIREYILSAKKAKINWPDRTHQFCYALASKIQNPAAWANAILECQHDPYFYEPFFKKLITNKDAGWEKVVHENLKESSPFRIVAITSLIQLEDLSDTLWCEVEKSMLESDAKWLGNRFQPIPEVNAKRVLQHPNAIIAAAFACSQWDILTKKIKFESLREDWEKAILGQKGRNHTIKEILKHEPGIALKWIISNLSKDRIEYEILELMKIGISKLNVDQRKKLLEVVPFTVGRKELLKYIIGKDVELYKILLSAEIDEYIKEAPLEGLLSDGWENMAITALNMGMSEEAIINGTRLKHYSWSGNESEYWKTRINNYDKFTKGTDPRVSRVANSLKKYAQHYFEKALARKTKEEIYGIE